MALIEEPCALWCKWRYSASYISPSYNIELNCTAMAEDYGSDYSLERAVEKKLDGQQASRARTIPKKLQDSAFELKENDPNSKFLYEA